MDEERSSRGNRTRQGSLDVAHSPHKGEHNMSNQVYNAAKRGDAALQRALARGADLNAVGRIRFTGAWCEGGAAAPSDSE